MKLFMEYQKKGLKKRYFPAVIIVFMIAIATGGLYFQSQPALADEPPKPQEAPQLNISGGTPPVINGHGTGYIPPPMDLSYINPQPLQGVAAFEQRLSQNGVMAPPSRLDWRTSGKVTSVKNQGGCGSCYAFAALANMESMLLIDSWGTYNFSENNAKECNWLHNSCGGGNFDTIINSLSKTGTALETCDPYIANYVNCEQSCTPSITPVDWRIISGNGLPSTDMLKSYIYTYGPVYTTIYASFPGFGTYDGSYTLYYTGTEATNHAVLIVGWDDTLVHAGGTGGWIVKNSWGTSWGGTCGYGTERGYFTIAYGSAGIGKYSSFMFDWQNYDSNGSVMYYDEGGWTNSWTYASSTTGWGLCKFIPTSNTKVYRVEFWTTDTTTDVDVYLYDTFDGTTLSTKLAEKLDNSFMEPGYHSVWLPSPVDVTAGNDIIAVIKFTNSSYIYPIAADCRGIHESGRTYLSPTGASGTWYDLGLNQRNSVAIRLRCSTSPPSSPSAPSPDNADKIGVFRPSSQYFYLDSNNDLAGGVGDTFLGPYGKSTDTPISGDWNGDGKDEIGVWRSSDKSFYLDYNGNGVWDNGVDIILGPYGRSDDKPIIGDWNNDGTDEIGVWRSSDKRFYPDMNNNGIWDGDKILGPYGRSDDTPIIGDWNNDGTDEIGVWRSSDQRFYPDMNNNGIWDGDKISAPYGLSTDKPVAGNWKR